MEAWRGFFDSFPDYRNVFDDVVDVGDGVVVVRGRSECSFAPLDGPAEWRAVVIDARVDVWQVSEPVPGAPCVGVSCVSPCCQGLTQEARGDEARLMTGHVSSKRLSSTPGRSRRDADSRAGCNAVDAHRPAVSHDDVSEAHSLARASSRISSCCPRLAAIGVSGCKPVYGSPAFMGPFRL